MVSDIIQEQLKGLSIFYAVLWMYLFNTLKISGSLGRH